MTAIYKGYESTFFLLAVCGLLSLSPADLSAQSLLDQLQNLTSEPAEGPSSDREASDNNADFNIAASMDRSDRSYLSGETFQLSVSSGRSGYIYIAGESNGKTDLIYPNDLAKANYIYARRHYAFPSRNAPYAWRIQGTPGTSENLIVVVSDRPLNTEKFEIDSLPGREKELFASDPIVTVPNFKVGRVTIKYDIVESRSQSAPSPSPTPSPQPGRSPKRIAILFSQTHKTEANTGNVVKDQNIRFRVGNGIHVRNLLMRFAKLDGEVDVVYGTDFNKKNIKERFASLARQTAPGDEIFIYWEGHGSRAVRDTTGREPDGKHEVLCMYDFQTNRKDGYIQDDEFADMLGVFRNRRVMIVMQSCHSGGLLESSSRDIGPSTADAAELLSESGLRRTCRGDIDYSKLLSTGDRVLDISGLRDVSVPGSEVDFSSIGALPSSSGLLESLHSLTGGAKNAEAEESVFIRNVSERLARTMAKDINPQTPNLAIVFSSSEDEVSYCATLNEKGEMLTLPDSEGTEFLIGPLVYSLVLATADTQGKYTANSDRSLFNDVWNVAKKLIPANAARIAASSEKARNAKQTPVYMNTIKDVCTRPPAP